MNHSNPDVVPSTRRTASRGIGPRSLVVPALLALFACGAPTNPGGGSSQGLSLTYPAAGQTLAGTASLAASGIGGVATALRFEIGGVNVDARADGTAYVDTRALSDGSHTVRASATVAGRDVVDEIVVNVDNDVPSSATVGPAGGSLKTIVGSFATIPPGALAGTASVTVDDATQAGILADFNVDYPALGVTFLGALEIDTGGATVALPVSVDLAGWAPAVQPGQRVVMFALAPDADGDGMGELMFAADAVATDAGSVITRPTPKSEVYGFGTSSSSGLATSQTTSARPGTIVTMTGRGFNPLSPLSNVVRYGTGTVPTAETLVAVAIIEDATFNPLLQVRFAVPALGTGSQTATLHNLTTGFRTPGTTLGVLALGTGSAATWASFRDQVAVAVAALTSARADLAAAASGWLATLVAADPATFAAMAAQSGLVSAANLTSLNAITATALSAAQADLVIRHALVLDAMAASTMGAQAAAAADLASLLMVLTRASEAGASSVGRAQSGSPPCTGASTTPTAGISWGAPVTTGMGSAQPGSCGAGGASGGGAGPQAATLSAAALARTSVRAGSFRPIARALVKVFRQGSTQALAPFTAITDPSGFFTIPFLAPGEPYTVRAIDLATLQVAESSGVANGVNVSTPMQLVFGVAEQGPGAPTASFVIRSVADDRFDGTTRFEFDASASTDDGFIEEYVWDFGGFVASVDWTSVVERGYGRNGTYDVRLTVIDDEGKAGTTTRQLTIDDLPYDYWGEPPERVSSGSNGEIPDAGTRYDYALTADGRYVTFSTDATNLHLDDVNGDTDRYLKDMDTGVLELVSSGAAGTSVGSGVGMSADARYVAFDAYPTATAEVRVHVKDRHEGTVEVVLPEAGLRRANVQALSGDGRTLVFQSSSLNGARHTYVKDLDTDEVIRLGLRLDGATYATNVSTVAISSDGLSVVFESIDPDLVPDDTNGQSDVFVYRLDTATTTRVSVAADGTQGDRGSDAYGTAITADGRYVTFWSEATTFPRATENDAPGGNDSVDDVYLKDLVTGSLTLVSTTAADVSADSDSVLPTISGDGRYVAFGSYASNLAPEMDEYDGVCALVMCSIGMSYVKDLQTGRVALVTVGLNDTVPNDWDQIEPILSADGRYVSYYSWATNLVTSTPAEDDYYRTVNPLWTP